MPCKTVDMLMYPDEVPTLLRSYDLETIAAVGNWGLEMIKRYPCSVSSDGSLRGSMAEVCAGIFCMGHYIGQIEAIMRKNAEQKNAETIDADAWESIVASVIDDLFNDLSPEDQQRVLYSGLKAAGFF